MPSAPSTSRSLVSLASSPDLKRVGASWYVLVSAVDRDLVEACRAAMRVSRTGTGALSGR
jgi:hypothetical protein